jgi:peptide/nickel transport system substrate-binding protein
MRGRILSAVLIAALIVVQTVSSPLAQTQSTFDKYELQGPRVDGIDISIFKTVEAEVLALQKGDIDMIDWSLPAEKLSEMRANPKLSVMSFPDYGIVYLAVNMRRPPLNDVKFRQALLYLIDRDRIVSEGLKGLGNVLPAGLVGPAYGDWQNKKIAEYSFDPAKAGQILNSAGYRLDSVSGKRIDPKTGSPLREIILLARMDDPVRKMAADLLSAEAQKIGIPMRPDPREWGYVRAKVMREYDYDIVTWGKSFIDIVDWMYYEFHSEMLPEKHGMQPTWRNVAGFNNPEYDSLAYKINFGDSIAEAKEACLKAQTILAEQLPYLPLYQATNVLAMNTMDWEGYVRRMGRIDSAIWWSAFNVRRKGAVFGGTWKLGFRSDIDKMNPFDSTTLIDWIALGEIYENLMISNPLRPLELVPWMASNWSRDSWEYAPGKKTPAITLKLVDNIKWHDGTKFTSKDVKFTVEYFRDKKSAYWFPNVQNVFKVETPDPLTVKIFTNETSPWWELWLGNLYIIPEHIWSNVRDPSLYQAWRERKLIGTGPFRFTEYKPGEYVRLSAYTDYFRRPSLQKSTLQPSTVTQGDALTIETPPVVSDGAPVQTGTFVVSVKDAAGRTVKSFKGSHRTAGIYAVVVETAGLQPGEYSVEGTVTYTAAGRENTLIVTKQLTVNSPFPVQLVAVPAIVVVTLAALIALRRRKKTK